MEMQTVLALVVMFTGTTHEIHMTTPISNTKYFPLQNDTRLVSNETWTIPNIMVVSGSSAAFFLCLAVSGGLFYICKRRKNTYRAAEPEELVYADVSIQKRQKKRSELKETGEALVEYGGVNLQKCPPPVFLDSVG